MLLSNDEVDVPRLDYSTMFASYKLDGVRILITRDGLLSRSLKPIRNTLINKKFGVLCSMLMPEEILECELYYKDLPCRITAGIVNSHCKDPLDLKLYCFDYYNSNLPSLDFLHRYSMYREYCRMSNIELIEPIIQHRVVSYLEVEDMFRIATNTDKEGLVLKCYSKPYKPGRVTIKQGIGYKIKPHKEEDLEIIGVLERMENTNESQINELGGSFKRNTKDAKKRTGIASCVVCKLPEGGTTKVTLTGDETYRRRVWETRGLFIGRIAVVKSMDYGAKDKLRHPRLVRVKEEVEY